MARQTIAPVAVPSPYATAPVVTTPVACDATNKEKIISTGREIITWNNSGSTSRTVTLTSVADGITGRTGDVTFTLAAGVSKTYGPVPQNGFMQSDGYLYCEAAHAEVLISVIQIR